MNWYRVTYRLHGKKVEPVELPAHSVMDAAQCALVKRRLQNEADGLELVDLECIDPPEAARAEGRQRSNAWMGVASLTDCLHAPKPADGDGETPP